MFLGRIVDTKNLLPVCAYARMWQGIHPKTPRGYTVTCTVVLFRFVLDASVIKSATQARLHLSFWGGGGNIFPEFCSFFSNTAVELMNTPAIPVYLVWYVNVGRVRGARGSEPQKPHFWKGPK